MYFYFWLDAKTGKVSWIDTGKENWRDLYFKLDGTPFEWSILKDKNTVEPVIADEPTEEVAEEPTEEIDIEALQAQYNELYGKEPATAYKNNAEWLQGKIDSFTA